MTSEYFNVDFLFVNMLKVLKSWLKKIRLCSLSMAHFRSCLHAIQT